MKLTSKQKTTRTTENHPAYSQATQSKGQAINPPASGIEIVDNQTVQRMPAPQPTLSAPVPENNTGLPDNLKAGIETLSGYSMGDVKVHYNSAKPAPLQAFAYTQGTDIHIAPGQERYLPHEAWHVVQQKQGRVKPTLQTKGISINNDKMLEHEADLMGVKALQNGHSSINTTQTTMGVATPTLQRTESTMATSSTRISQNQPIQFGNGFKEERENYRKSQYKKGIDPKEARERRREAYFQYSKKKRQELIDKKRQQFTESLSNNKAPSFSTQPPSSGFGVPVFGQTTPLSSPYFGSSSLINQQPPSGFSFAPPPFSSQPPSSGFGSSVFGQSAPLSSSDFGGFAFERPSSLKFGAPLFETPSPSLDLHSRFTQSDLPVSSLNIDENEELEELISQFESLTISFQTGLDDETHQIYPTPDLDDIIIATDPVPLQHIINTRTWLKIILTVPEITALKNLKKDVVTALNAVRNSASLLNNNLLRKAMKAVANFLSGKGTVQIPLTDLSNSTSYGTLTSSTEKTVGKKLIASPLSVRSKYSGTSANDGALMVELRKKVVAAGGISKDPIQAHLLNMKTWGPGELWNLTPASKKFNTDQEGKQETPLKAAIYEKGLVMYFEAEVSYNNYPVGNDYVANPQKYLFSRITFRAHQLHEDIVTNAYVRDNTIANDPDIQKVNTYMPWDQGNLPQLVASPKVHTEKDPNAFKDLGWPQSVINALTDYNDNVKVGDDIPNMVLTKRTKWKGNVGINTFLSDLQAWLDNPACTVTQKRVASKNKMPPNWKQQLDFDL